MAAAEQTHNLKGRVLYLKDTGVTGIQCVEGPVEAILELSQ